MDLLKNLNPGQAAAAGHFTGPALVLSGPGSGKTRVITHRIAHLIKEKGVRPENILAVTFTNKAANEMKERVLHLLSNEFSLPIMGTFHSICSRILRESGGYIGINTNFVIFDDDDSLSLIKGVMKDLNINTKQFSPNTVKNSIESSKNELIGPQEYGSFAQGFFQREIVTKVYLAYQKDLEDQNGLDFEDLIRKTVLLFEKEPKLLEKYQNRFQFILIDEYQDTNKSQYIFTKLLAAKHRNLFVVGDAAQAIYGWRGADYKNILNFSSDFAEAKVYNLDQNYRSTKKILSAASAVISQNRSHPVLSLWTDNTEGSPLVVYEAKNELEEAGFITRIINRSVSNQSGLSYGSFAVLYRTNAQSRVIEESFLQEGIPYVLVGGTRFYERREIKDILAYLRLVLNPKDKTAFKRVVNTPPRGIGPAALKDKANPKMRNFEELLTELRIKSANLQTLDIINLILEKTKYRDWLDDGSLEAASRIENIKELGSVAATFPNLVDFLENVALVEREYDSAASQRGDQKDAVTLMTFHAAKGLEFPVVFMIGMEEGLFPHSRSFMDRDELEEERRLCYVGITRAKEQVYLTYTQQRLYFGQRSEGMPSRFLIEIPPDLVTTIRF
jgi:DNA helicase-2/ATP-dependent DNA helicase PcrA